MRSSVRALLAIAVSVLANLTAQQAEGQGPDDVGSLLLTGRDRRAIDLLETLTLADRQSLDGRRASARTRIAAGEALEARLGWIPGLTASAGKGRTEGQVQGSFGDFRELDFRSVAPFGRLSLALNPAAAWFDASAAARRAESARAQEQAVRRLVLVRVSELYYEVVREKAGVRISEMAVRDARDFLRIAEVLLRQGMGRGDDAERARAELASAEQRLLQGHRRFQIASIDLATTLDLDPNVTLDPAGDAPEQVRLIPGDGEFAPLLQEALAARPELAAARRLLEARRAERSGRTAALASPTVEAFYQEGATGEAYGDLAELRRSGVMLTWTLSARSFQGVRTASAGFEEASLVLVQAERQVRAEVTAAWVDVQIATAGIDKAREEREASEATLRISQVRYRNGASLAIEVLQAGQALERARLAEIAALVDYNQAQIRLRAQMRSVMPADLARPATDGGGALDKTQEPL